MDVDKLKLMLYDERNAIAEEQAKGKTDGSFLSLYGMTIENKLESRYEAITDVMQWISTLEKE